MGDSDCQVRTSSIFLTPSTRLSLKRQSVRDIQISEEEMNKIYRSTKTSNTPSNFSWVIPDKLGRNNFKHFVYLKTNSVFH